MNFTYYIELNEDHGVEVEFAITRFVDKKADRGADNPWDYYGYTEVEFDQVSHLDNPEVVKIVEENFGDIESVAIEAALEYKKEMEQDCYEYADYY